MAKQFAGKRHRRVGGKLIGTLAQPLLILACCALSLVWTSAAQAENLIKQPGQHNKYSWELEPHLYIRYGGYWGAEWGHGAGVGPGIRASIPFMHNGPIKTINNNIGISFGLDTPFYFNGGMAFDIPVAFQWNFYFTKIISVIGEAGLLSSIWTGHDHTQFYAFPIIQGAGRFQFGKVGIVARVGFPSTSVGANFQF
ncbi:MAG TPA: hypothetical protein VN764_02215 [Polyangiaceae bacterium]|nr:hypothetical protein [Polyangiaceae bacterium]